MHQDQRCLLMSLAPTRWVLQLVMPWSLGFNHDRQRLRLPKWQDTYIFSRFYICYDMICILYIYIYRVCIYNVCIPLKIALKGLDPWFCSYKPCLPAPPPKPLYRITLQSWGANPFFGKPPAIWKGSNALVRHPTWVMKDYFVEAQFGGFLVLLRLKTLKKWFLILIL